MRPRAWRTLSTRATRPLAARVTWAWASGAWATPRVNPPVMSIRNQASVDVYSLTAW